MSDPDITPPEKQKRVDPTEKICGVCHGRNEDCATCDGKSEPCCPDKL